MSRPGVVPGSRSAGSDQVWFVPDVPPAPDEAAALRAANAGLRRVIEHGDVRIEILFEGDEDGQGLVRTCTYRVPKLLPAGGRPKDWLLTWTPRACYALSLP